MPLCTFCTLRTFCFLSCIRMLVGCGDGRSETFQMLRRRERWSTNFLRGDFSIRETVTLNLSVESVYRGGRWATFRLQRERTDGAQITHECPHMQVKWSRQTVEKLKHKFGEIKQDASSTKIQRQDVLLSNKLSLYYINTVP